MTKCSSFVQLNLCIYIFAHAWGIFLCHFSGSTSFLSGVNRKHYMSCVQETLCVRVYVSRLYMHVYISVTSLSAFAISPSHSHSFNQVWDTERARHCHLSTSAAQPYLMTTNGAIWTTSAYGPTVYTLIFTCTCVHTPFSLLRSAFCLYAYARMYIFTYTQEPHADGSSTERNVTKSDWVLLTNKHYCMQRACPHKLTPPTYASLYLDY